MPVGTDLGNVYKSREGFGRAAILPSQNTFNQAYKVAKAATTPKPKAPKVNAQEVIKNIKSDKKDWWHVHDNKLNDEFNEILEYGLDIMDKNVDPTKGNDKASRDWRQRFDRLNTKAGKSMQLREQYREIKNIINNKEKDIQDDSIVEVGEFVDRDLDDIMESGDVFPTLRYKDDPFKYADAIGKRAKEFTTTNKNYSDDDIKEQVTLMMADPSMGDHINNLLLPEIKKLPTEKQNQLMSDATDAGYNDVVGFMLHKDFESQLGMPPTDVKSLIKKHIPALETVERSIKDDDGVTRRTLIQELPQDKADEAAKILLDTNPRLLSQMVDDGYAKDRESAEEYISDMMINQAAKRDLYSKTWTKSDSYKGSGYGRKEVDDDHDFYDSAMRGHIDYIEELGDLTEEEKWILREATGGYAAGTQFGKETGGIIDFDEELGKTGSSAFKGKTLAPEVQAQRWNQYPVVYQVKAGKTKDGKAAGKQQYENKVQYYNLVDRKADNFLEPGQTWKWYDEAFGKNQKLFKEIAIQRILDYRKSQDLSNQFEAAQEDDWGAEAEKTTKKRTPY
jgi:hypothetical protein